MSLAVEEEAASMASTQHSKNKKQIEREKRKVKGDGNKRGEKESNK